MPLEAVSILVTDLWPLGIDQIPILAAVEADLDLLLVKLVKPILQGVLQARYLAAWMEDLPGLDTRLSLARLENQHQSVETVYDLTDTLSQE